MQICHAIGRIQEKFTPDDARNTYRAILYSWIAELQPVIHGPGQRVVSARGLTVIDENGAPVYDPSVKTDAIRAGVLLIESLRKLDALDRVRIPARENPAGLDEALSYLNQLDSENQELRRQLSALTRALPGEIVDADIVSS